MCRMVKPHSPWERERETERQRAQDQIASKQVLTFAGLRRWPTNLCLPYSRATLKVPLFICDAIKPLSDFFFFFFCSHICKMHNRAVSPGPLLSVDIFTRQWFCKRTEKALIRLRACAVWSGPSLSTHALMKSPWRNRFFAWCGESTFNRFSPSEAFWTWPLDANMTVNTIFLSKSVRP